MTNFHDTDGQREQFGIGVVADRNITAQMLEE
jgi:hypothetical protein